MPCHGMSFLVIRKVVTHKLRSSVSFAIYLTVIVKAELLHIKHYFFLTRTKSNNITYEIYVSPKQSDQFLCSELNKDRKTKEWVEKRLSQN